MDSVYWSKKNTKNTSSVSDVHGNLLECFIDANAFISILCGADMIDLILTFRWQQICTVFMFLSWSFYESFFLLLCVWMFQVQVTHESSLDCWDTIYCWIRDTECHQQIKSWLSHVFTILSCTYGLDRHIKLTWIFFPVWENCYVIGSFYNVAQSTVFWLNGMV